MIAKRANSKFMLLAAGVLISGALAVAQDPGGMPGGGGGGMQQPTPGTAPGYPGAQPMPGNTAGGSPGMQPSMADQSFIRQMFESDAVEVQLGEMAQQKSQSDDIKQFAEKMVENRKHLDDQLAPLAKRLDVSQPKGPDKKMKQEIAKLQTLSGQQFDEEYIRTIEKAHEKDVKSFKQAADASQDPSVQRTAQADAPIIEQHLQAIQKIAQSHNVQTESSESKK
jgi:putative membrane protein